VSTIAIIAKIIKDALSFVALDASTGRALASANQSVAVHIIPELGLRHRVMPQTAATEFEDAVRRLAGPTEKDRAAHLMLAVLVVPDDPSERMARLRTTRQLGANDIQIFGTADRLGVQIFTSDAAAARAIRAQGVPVNAFVHQPMSFIGA
jgi:hypothetical protein